MCEHKVKGKFSDEDLVFIISLPRSGSTLLQRILATRADFVTLSESWLLLPQIGLLFDEGIYAEYNQKLAITAITEFMQNITKN
jgi:hypothetical protein